VTRNPSNVPTSLIPWLRNVAQELEFPLKGVTVRFQRTLWASCSHRDTVSLNARLLLIPPGLVRYVFIHELAHTRHRNHRANSGSWWPRTSRISETSAPSFSGCGMRWKSRVLQLNWPRVSRFPLTRPACRSGSSLFSMGGVGRIPACRQSGKSS
jgi:hypothetical protein